MAVRKVVLRTSAYYTAAWPWLQHSMRVWAKSKIDLLLFAYWWRIGKLEIASLFFWGEGCSELHSLNCSLYSFLFVEALRSCGKFWLAFVKKYQEKIIFICGFSGEFPRPVGSWSKTSKRLKSCDVNPDPVGS